MINLAEITEQEIKLKFPMKEYRPGQLETIKAIIKSFNNRKKFVILEAPTGSGKSAIGMALAQLFDESYYLTPQKFLQDQLIRDFGENGVHIEENIWPMIDLKGRNAYPCNYYKRKLNTKDVGKERAKYEELALNPPGCDEGKCKKEGKARLDFCFGSDGAICPYYIRLDQALHSKLCLMNFHSFLFQTFVTQKFGNRQLMIIDEGHMVEDVLLSFIEIRLTDFHFMKDSIVFSKLETIEEYIKFFDEVKIIEKIISKMEIAKLSGLHKEENEWSQLLLKYAIMKKSDLSNWITIFETSKNGVNSIVTLKPLMIDKFVQEFIFSKADFILLMSATILSKKVICDSLGISSEEVHFIRLSSNFPPEIRPIKYVPSGSMNYNNKMETLPKLLKDIEKICLNHKNERGIIHTHTFDIAEYIVVNSSLELRTRLIYQKHYNNDKNEMLKVHAKIKDAILIAPAMHEGLDLKDDLGRFQIICKVPYPSKGDPQIAARMEIDPEYYDWRAAIKIVQSYGRIYRHDKDHGITYILDSGFKRFYEMTEKILPKWFKEVIKWS